MAYASRADLVAAFGPGEIAQLEAQGRDVAAAIQVAEAEADSYLGARYQLPVSPITPKLTRVVCDLARYQLFGVVSDGEPKDRAQAAVAWLRDVAARRAGIEGAAPAVATAGSAIAGQSPARSGQADSQFNWSGY